MLRFHININSDFRITDYVWAQKKERKYLFSFLCPKSKFSNQELAYHHHQRRKIREINFSTVQVSGSLTAPHVTNGAEDETTKYTRRWLVRLKWAYVLVRFTYADTHYHFPHTRFQLKSKCVIKYRTTLLRKNLNLDEWVWWPIRG